MNVVYEPSMAALVRPKLTARQKIMRIQDEVAKLPQEIPEPKHHFAPHLYGREIVLRAGMLIVGKLHRHAHLVTLSCGRVKAVSAFGYEEYKAPRTFTSPVGAKRVILALEDTVLTTYYVTDETDLDKIEDYVIAKDYSEIPQVERGTVRLLEMEQS